MTNPTQYALVHKVPTEEMVDAYWTQTGESHEMRARVHHRAKRYYELMLAAAPHAGEVSREQLDRAAQKLREHGDYLYKVGLDKPWDMLGEKQRNIHRASVRVVLKALGLSVEGEN